MIEEKIILKPKEPIGYFYHEPTMTSIAVYHRIPKIQRWLIKICFGLVYKEMED